MNKKWNTQEIINKLIEIDGFDQITAKQFAQNLPKFKEFFNKLNDIYDVTDFKVYKSTIKKSNKSKLNEKKIVFTGFRDKELEQQIIELGGTVSTSISSKTDIVIYGDATGAKYKKAVSLNKELLTKDEFKKKYID